MSLQVSWAAPLSWTGSADFSRAHSACLWQLAGWRWQRRLTATCRCPAGSPELVHRVAAGLQKNQQKPESFLRPKLGTALISTRSIDQSKLQGPSRFGRRRSCKVTLQRAWPEGGVALWQPSTSSYRNWVHLKFWSFSWWYSNCL